MPAFGDCHRSKENVGLKDFGPLSIGFRKPPWMIGIIQYEIAACYSVHINDDFCVAVG
jgi:hypothetical protein